MFGHFNRMYAVVRAFSFWPCSAKLNNVQYRTRVDFEDTERLLATIHERLHEFGVALESLAPAPGHDGSDAVLALSRGGVATVYSVQVVTPMTLTTVAQRGYTGAGPLLVVGDRISRRSADALREANIQFIDALGNAHIAFGDVFVDVRGRIEQASQGPANPPRSSASQSTNLFSRGRAQVIMVLLAWPELAGGVRREIAKAAKTSLGQTHDVLIKLEKAGFLLPTSRKLNRYDELLDLWTAAYPTGLGHRLEVARFHGDPTRPVVWEHPVYLSGETAAGIEIARPSTLTVYLDQADPRLAIENRWSRNPDRTSNIFVRHKFWTSPHPSEEDPMMRMQNAPWPLVYADLMATGDARLGEVARTWRAHRARFDQS